MTREEEIRARCEEAVKMLRGLLPEKVDYAELVCAEGFARGFQYVWTDPEPYAMDEAANCIEVLLDENARLRAELEAAKRDLRQAGWGNLCEICAHNSEGDDPHACLMCDGEPGHSGFEWRGPQEGENNG